MASLRHSSVLRYVPALVVVVALIATLAFGANTGSSPDEDVTLLAQDPGTPIPTLPATPDPTGIGGMTDELPAATPAIAPTLAPTPEPTQAPASAGIMTPEQLVQYQPNELGVVPVLEYHAITTNPEEEAQFVRMADDFRADLQWLYDNNFYVVPLRDVVNNTIAVPAGKHPVALTFDDGQSSQFRFIEDANGNLVPDPDTAIGILEAFYQEHPDFGGGGHFGILVYNAFANPDESQEPYFHQKLEWMIERGYEIGNHTWQHTNLTDLEDDEFMMTVGEPILWANETLGDIPANASSILTLPYGTSPDVEKRPGQRKMMREGFTYKGEELRIEAALLVGAEPAVSPASALWDPMWIPRIQMFDESVDFWFGIFERGDTILYVSDGNPDTIVVPMPLHPLLDGQLDADALEAAGKTVILYDPETGEDVAMGGAPVAVVPRGILG